MAATVDDTAVEPSIFISYAHEDAALVHELARHLAAHDARVWIDQGELSVGDSLIEKISEAIAETDFVVALVSEASRSSPWCRKELSLALSEQLSERQSKVKLMPVRVGDVVMPPSLRDVLYIQLKEEDIPSCAEALIESAQKHLGRFGRQVELESAKSPARRRANAAISEIEPIKMIGIVTERVTMPTLDGSPRSALYNIPIRLNRKPPHEWSQAFPERWDNPPAYTTMHRSGIARIEGDCIVLVGTTVEELEKYHLATLKLVLAKLNDDFTKYEDDRRQIAERDDAARSLHSDLVEDVAARMDFHG